MILRNPRRETLCPRPTNATRVLSSNAAEALCRLRQKLPRINAAGFLSDRLQPTPFLPLPSPCRVVELPSVLGPIVPETGRTLSASDVPPLTTPAVDIFLEGYVRKRQNRGIFRGK